MTEIIVGTLIVGYVLDLIFGDPHGMWHPICFIGNMISFFERRLQSDCVHEQVAKADCECPLYERIRGSKKEQKQKQLDTTNTNESKKDGCDKKRESEVFHEPNRELAGGVLLVICVLAVSTAIPLVILMICYRIWFWLGFVVQSYMCYTILATKSLKTESMKVAEVLQTDGLEAGRKAVSMIVGRDTQNLTETGVVKAAVETVAENTSDGILAPMFYMAIGGPVLGYFYKAVNTMDSMVGYKNDKYLYFGRAAAKFDDVMNFIPARLSAIMMILAAPLVKLDGASAWKIFKRDRLNHASPNSAQTEAVMAGALQVQLAGDAWYFGKKHEKPTIGDAVRPVEIEDIARANKLLYAASLLGMIVFCGIRIAVWFGIKMEL
jgi:adenosylcobinamide-phosphate synthase